MVVLKKETISLVIPKFKFEYVANVKVYSMALSLGFLGFDK
jgi:hypothetical protein